MAKPKVILTENERNLIIALFEMGTTERIICAILKLPKTTFHDIIKYNGLTDRIKKGIANEKVKVSLYQQCLKGNLGAICFWLCNRDKENWQNVNKVEHGGKIDVNHLKNKSEKALFEEYQKQQELIEKGKQE